MKRVLYTIPQNVTSTFSLHTTLCLTAILPSCLPHSLPSHNGPRTNAVQLGTLPHKPPIIRIPYACSLSEPCRTPPHRFALADELGIKFATVERKVDIEVNPIERALRRIHPLEILLQILPRQIRRQRHDFLDTYKPTNQSSPSTHRSHNHRQAKEMGKDLRGSLVYSGQTSSSQAYKISSYINVAPGATCLKKLTLTGSPFLTRWPFCTKICRVYLQRSLPSKLGTRYCSG